MTDPSKLDLARYGILTAQEAVARGFSKGAIRHRLATGQWVALRRGLYAEASDLATFDPAAVQTAAALAVIGPGAAGSHWSAANVLNVQTLLTVGNVWVTRPPTSRNGRHMLPGIVERAASLPPHHVIFTQGIPITSAARTLIDIARMSGLDAAVVSIDCALRLALTTVEELCLVADDCHAWPGGSRPMRAIRHADGLSESPLESLSRMAFVRMQLPEPELQVPFFDAAGPIGRVDFYWKAHRTVGEADGRMKYDQAQALWDEKRREDRLRELGLQVVRWSHGDITQIPTVVYDRLIAAFRRGDRP
ncbi:MAG TPA: type IV toxin-antitoxin system AbiEi family antitoxin domain-containing protein [Acidothermaceae bacterium]|nr:type IV toxin-antitoxin system AbiEi family antitoxin domain-containing protein [Acidothermaceae bacterium]